MLERSFIFLDRITLEGERRLWQQGIRDWDAFLARDRIPGYSPARKLYYDRKLRRMAALLQAQAYDALARAVPRSEHWRFYDLVKEETAALDIETSGYYGDITVVGLHQAGSTRFLVQSKNLSTTRLREALASSSALLTFNGASFDLPVMARTYPGLRSRFRKLLHIDLRHVAARVGLTGGLKSIEIVLGIRRPEEVDGMDGSEAVMLWSLYTADRDEEALELLLDYNRADTENLFLIADMLIPRLWRRLRNT